jgi:protein O-mannosyl-transferase
MPGSAFRAVHPPSVDPWPFAVGGLAFLTHVGALWNGFAYDDVTLVLGDERVRSLGGLRAFFLDGYWGDAALSLYRPLTTLSFAVDHAVAGPSPGWFHFTNLLLHVAVTVMVLVLARRFLPAIGALAAAALFAVHPVHVEAVANVAGRAELLAAALMLAACIAWTGAATPATPARRWWLVPPLLLLALFAKESAVVLPLLLLLLDAVRGLLNGRSLGEYVRARLVAAGCMAAVAGIYVILRLTALDSLAPTRLDPALEVAAGQAGRVLTALQAWPHYLRLLVFPRTLLADYGPQIITPATPLSVGTLLGAVLLTGVAVALVIAQRNRCTVGVLALGWFLITIAPVSNLIIPIGIVVAERTLYLPSFAVALAFGALCAALAACARQRPRAPTAVLALALLVIAAAAVRSAVRVPEWRSTEAIFAAQLRDRPDSFRGHWYAARRQRAVSNDVAALESYTTALRLWPHRQALVIEAAAFAAGAGYIEWARDLAARAVAAWPTDVHAHRLLAAASLDLGDTVTARRAIDAGLRIEPTDELLLRMHAALIDQDGPR